MSAVLGLRRQGAVFVLNGERLTVRATPEVREKAKESKPQILAELRAPYAGSWLDLTVEAMLGLATGERLRQLLKRVDDAGRGGTLAAALAVADAIGAEGVRLAATDHLPGLTGRALRDAAVRIFAEIEVDAPKRAINKDAFAA